MTVIILIFCSISSLLLTVRKISIAMDMGPIYATHVYSTAYAMARCLTVHHTNTVLCQNGRAALYVVKTAAAAREALSS